jgi:hypothetical protein
MRRPFYFLKKAFFTPFFAPRTNTLPVWSLNFNPLNPFKSNTKARIAFGMDAG